MNKLLKSFKNIIVSFLILILIWQVLVTAFNINPTLFPAPLKVLDAFKELLTTGLRGSSSDATLFSHIGISLFRFFCGYLLAVVLAVVLGLILGWFPKVFAYVNPIVQLIRPIAPVAWLPFIVLWVGIGSAPAIVIIFIAGFFPILLSTVTAVVSIDPIYLKVAQNFGISRGMTLIKIVFPAIFSQIATSLHLALGSSWVFLVSGEMVGAQSGLGFLVMDAKNCIRSDALLATMITIGLIGLVLDVLIRLFERFIAVKFGYGADRFIVND
ncbi:ABC transporter permease [Anaerosporobacter sp.]|uniref:ABC transporter permease n=1 Tax=Anaerosporobacter sp. TaxID=1872529 RepID=UPI00286EFAE3|nr:ABC transporter permease [Anaerosporobacter sp.]